MSHATLLQGVPNFRDVGQTVNKFLGERRIREGLLYRSARLDDATDEDKQIIRHELDVQTIIDLRTRTEILDQVEKRKSGTASNTPGCPIDGVDYRGIKITGRPFERHLLSQLSWWDFFQVILFYLLGYRIDAVRIISHQVLLPRGLVGLGLDTLDLSGAEICEILSLGLICALLLMILGIPTIAIERDYFLTDIALENHRDEMLAEISGIGLTDEWAITAEDMIMAIEGHLQDKYGGLEHYLDRIGFGQTSRAQLRDILLY